jgi:hypothetical protein
VSVWSRTNGVVVAYGALFVLLDVVERLPGASLRVPLPVLVFDVMLEGWLVWGLVRRSPVAWAVCLSLALLGVMSFVIDLPRDAEVTTILVVSLAQAGLLLTPRLRGLVWSKPPTSSASA